MAHLVRRAARVAPLIVRSGDGDARPLAMMRSWSTALTEVLEPERRCAIALAAALPLVRARRGLIFNDDGIRVTVPDSRGGSVPRRLLAAARSAHGDEFAGPRLYVARLRPGRPDRLALQWASDDEAAVRLARTTVAACAWALEPGAFTLPAAVELPDRAATLRQFDALAQLSARLGRPFAVLQIEVRTLAFPARAALAQALRAVVRAGDVFGRLGPDTFLAVLALAEDELEAFAAAERLLGTAQRAAVGADPVVGVAVHPQDGAEPAELLRRAAAAAARPGAAETPGVRWYRTAASAALSARTGLRRRLADDPGASLALRFRPIVDTATDALVGAVADVGLRDGAGDGEPFELSGRNDAAVRRRVEAWALGAAAEALALWHAAGLELRVHVAVDALSEPLLDTVAQTFGRRTWLRRLCLELGEAAFAQPQDAALALLRRLRSRGVMLGLDLRRASTRTLTGLATLPLDLVVVDLSGYADARAMVALGTMVAPLVLGEVVPGGERSPWLRRNGVGEARPGRAAAGLDAAGFAAWARARSAHAD